MEDNTLSEFAIEADELLNEAEKSLLSLDHGGDFESNYNSVFRVFHSLKGAAGMLNLEDLKEHMHKTENLFQELKTRGKISKSEVDFFLRATDCARKILQGEKVSLEYCIDSNEAKLSPMSIKDEGKRIEKWPHIFIVDDESDIVDVLKEFLKDFECNVTGFTNPKDALAQVPHKSPCVILSDIHMPQMSGVDLMKSAQDLDPAIAFVLISGRVDKEVLLKSIEQGVYAVIEKPFQRTAVTSITTAALEKYKLIKLVSKSINMIMYQYADLEDYLLSNNKQNNIKLIKNEIESLNKQFRILTKKNNQAA